jgi:hypothetical protein
LGPSAESQISQKARKLGGWEAIKLKAQSSRLKAQSQSTDYIKSS